jgi:hypothetical protein
VTVVFYTSGGDGATYTMQHMEMASWHQPVAGLARIHVSLSLGGQGSKAANRVGLRESAASPEPPRRLLSFRCEMVWCCAGS